MIRRPAGARAARQEWVVAAAKKKLPSGTDKTINQDLRISGVSAQNLIPKFRAPRMHKSQSRRLRQMPRKRLGGGEGGEAAGGWVYV